MTQDVCTTHVVHQEAVDKVKENLPNDEILLEVSEFFKSFSDKTRMKLICALLEQELCVCDLATVVELSQSAVSHQLRILRQARLVKYRKVGKTVYYSLDDEHVQQVIKESLSHLSHK